MKKHVDSLAALSGIVTWLCLLLPLLSDDLVAQVERDAFPAVASFAVVCLAWLTGRLVFWLGAQVREAKELKVEVDRLIREQTSIGASWRVNWEERQHMLREVTAQKLVAEQSLARIKSAFSRYDAGVEVIVDNSGNNRGSLIRTLTAMWHELCNLRKDPAIETVIAELRVANQESPSATYCEFHVAMRKRVEEKQEEAEARHAKRKQCA